MAKSGNATGGARVSADQKLQVEMWQREDCGQVPDHQKKGCVYTSFETMIQSQRVLRMIPEKPGSFSPS